MGGYETNPEYMIADEGALRALYKETHPLAALKSLIDADRDQLNRVLTNLLRNAIQAIEAVDDGSGRMSDGHVTISAWRQGSVLTIEVRDDGPGIPERVRPKLFEAFQSAAKPGGVGLGLAIAAELIRAHGGEIRLQDTGPEGTIFHVAVPDQVVELRPGRRGERARSGSA